MFRVHELLRKGWELCSTENWQEIWNWLKQEVRYIVLQDASSFWELRILHEIGDMEGFGLSLSEAFALEFGGRRREALLNRRCDLGYHRVHVRLLLLGLFGRRNDWCRLGFFGRRVNADVFALEEFVLGYGLRLKFALFEVDLLVVEDCFLRLLPGTLLG